MLVSNLKGGSIDMAMRLTNIQAAELTEGFHIEEGTMNLVQALFLNNAVEPLNNEKVKQVPNGAWMTSFVTVGFSALLSTILNIKRAPLL